MARDVPTLSSAVLTASPAAWSRREHLLHNPRLGFDGKLAPQLLPGISPVQMVYGMVSELSMRNKIESISCSSPMLCEIDALCENGESHSTLAKRHKVSWSK